MKLAVKRINLITAFIAAALFMLILVQGSVTARAESKVTIKVESAKVRSSASTSSEQVGSAASGQTYSVSSTTTGDDGKTWYEITVDGKKGFVREDLVSVSGDAPKSEAQVTETAATVTESSAAEGEVTAKSVNVRKGPAATDAVVTSLKKGASVTITGEATGADGKLWYAVDASGKTGYVHSDYVEVTKQVEAEEPEETEETEEEGDAEQVPDPENSTSIKYVIASRVIPGDIDIEDMEVSEDTLKEWTTGNFYLIYTEEKDGDNWYLYSANDGGIERISSLKPSEEETGKKSLFEGNKIVLISLGAVIIILLIVCIIMGVKLHEYSQYEFEDDEDEDDEEEEEDDEDEDDEEEERPVRKGSGSRNFIRRRRDEEDDEDDEEEDEDEDEDEDEEEELRPRKKSKGSSRAVSSKPSKPSKKRNDYEDFDDDDFEFEFLNIDRK